MTYLGVDFPKTPEPRPHEGRETFVKSYEEIQRRTGHVLSPVGRQRLLLMAVHQCLAQNADLSNIETYILCFNKLVEWEAFEQSGTLELGYDPEKKEIVHENVTPKKLSVEDIEGLDTSTASGAAQAKAILADAVFGENGEARVMWDQWLAHLRRDYNFFPDETAQKAVIDFFIRANASFLSHDAFNRARRWATSNGVFPPDMLTEDERLSAAIEANTATDYETQKKLKRQVIAARQ